ncbi:MAG TPA: hypothetical protein VGK96_28620 [Candidatus Sulfotelmatobacter sp.]|jgi:hypothetical protein
MAFRNWLQWVDAAGRVRLTRFDCGPVAGGAIRLALQNVSNAGLVAVTAGSVGGPYTEGGLGTYASVNTALQAFFQDTAGGIFTLMIPAPFDSLFEADGVTAGGLVWNALLVVLETGLFNPASGLNVSSTLGGVRVGGNSGN